MVVTVHASVISCGDQRIPENSISMQRTQKYEQMTPDERWQASRSYADRKLVLISTRNQRGELGARSEPISVQNSYDTSYTVDITVGGKVIPVIVDTGSSDLWVHEKCVKSQCFSKIEGITETPHQFIYNYDCGLVRGQIVEADIRLGNLKAAMFFGLVSKAKCLPRDIKGEIVGVWKAIGWESS